MTTSTSVERLFSRMPWSIAALASRGGASDAAVPTSNATSVNTLRRR